MNKKIEEILEEYKNIESFSQAQRLMHWDMETHMPEKGIDFRSEAMARIEMFQQERIVKLHDKVDAVEMKNLTDIEKGIIRVLKRSIHYYISIPPDVIKELSKTTSKAAMVWRESRKRSDFSSFEPYLVRIVELQKQIASYLGYEKHPYNALMDLYEEGFTVAYADEIFDKLLNNTKPVLDKIIEERKFYVQHPLENKKYRIDSMKKINEKVLDILKMPMDRFRMDISAHPFTTHISMDYDEHDIYIYFNTVNPSLIRVDADEVTYNFHIALRYEIEKNLLTGKFAVSDLPEIWNDFMEKYLGIRPKNVSEGVLQDIHWSQGSFGYFPTYSLGNIISAIIRSQIKDLYENIGMGNIDYIKKFLGDKVHRYGSIYTPKDLLKMSFNENYNPDYLIKYFREKYL